MSGVQRTPNSGEFGYLPGKLVCNVTHVDQTTASVAENLAVSRGHAGGKAAPVDVLLKAEFRREVVDFVLVAGRLERPDRAQVNRLALRSKLRQGPEQDFQALAGTKQPDDAQRPRRRGRLALDK